MNKRVLCLFLALSFVTTGFAATYEELRQQEDERIMKEEKREKALRAVIRQQKQKTNPMPKDSGVIWFESDSNMRLLDIPEENKTKQTPGTFTPVYKQPKDGEREPLFPARNTWATGDDLTDSLIDGLLLRFVRIVMRQLRAERGRDFQPTYHDLMTAFMTAWCRYTPYTSAAKGVGRKLGALKDTMTGKVKDNDWRIIFRRGYGICGDYSQLLKKILKLALFHPRCRYIIDVEPLRAPISEISVFEGNAVGFGRVDEVYFIGKPNKTHCALGIINKDAWNSCLRQINEHQQDGSIKKNHLADLTNLSKYDITIYDLFLRPIIIGKMSLGEWGGKCNAEAFVVKRMVSSSYRLVFGPDSMAPRAQW